MVALLRYDAPWLWGYHPKDYGLYHQWFQNVKPNRISNNNVKYYRIDVDLRNLKRREWNKPVLWPVALVLMIVMVGLFPAISAYRRRENSMGIKNSLLKPD